MQQIPTGCLFYTRQCVCFRAALWIRPTLSFTHCVHKSILYISRCLSEHRTSSIVISCKCIIFNGKRSKLTRKKKKKSVIWDNSGLPSYLTLNPVRPFWKFYCMAFIWSPFCSQKYPLHASPLSPSLPPSLRGWPHSLPPSLASTSIQLTCLPVPPPTTSSLRLNRPLASLRLLFPPLKSHFTC